MKLLPCIEKRTSVRKFSKKEVEKEIITRILEAGRKAPSAKNRQPWRFIVIDDKDLKYRVEEAAFGQEHVGQAPVIIAACTTNIDYKMPNGQLSYPIDLSFAVSFMMLQSEEEGLGSCVITTYKERDILEMLTVPFSMRVVMLLLLGYPEEKPDIPTERKPLESLVSYNHW